MAATIREPRRNQAREGGGAIMSSAKRLARIAGLLYLTIAIAAGFAYGYVLLTKVYAPGDAATTAANVVANSDLVRLGVVADLLQATVMAFLAMTFYQLFKHVNRNAAGALVIFAAIAVAIMCLNNVFQFAALLVATDTSYAAAFGAQGSNALVLLLLDMQHYGYLIAQIFFGLWLVPMGYLAHKSGMFPRALGGVLIVGGVCYLVDMLALFLVPDFGERIHSFLIITPTIAEIWMVGYLLVKGVKGPAQGTGSQPSARGTPVELDSAVTSVGAV